MSSSSPAQRVPVGIRHLVASAFFFSLMSVFVKLAGDRLPSHQLVLARGVVCLVLSWAWLKRAAVHPWGTRPSVLLLRGLFGTLALLCFYYALVTLPLAEAVVIHQSSPIMTAVLAVLLLSERGGVRLYLAMMASLAGVLIITRPAFLFGEAAAHTLPPLGLLAAFGGAFGAALVYVLVRSLGSREHPMVVVFYFPLVTAPLVAPLAISVWVWPTAIEWLWLLAIGITTQLAQVHLTQGLVYEPAGRAASVGYLQVVLVTIWGALLFDEIPDGLTVAGAMLIIASTVALAIASRRPPPPDPTAVAAD